VPFRDRIEAGRLLADRLRHLSREDVVVLGLPRGGVPIGVQVAEILGAPLDVILVRKLGVPSQPELAMGAIGEGGARVINRRVVEAASVTDDELASAEDRESVELERRARLYRGGRPPVPLAGRTALIVDDGIATGSTARAACLVARARGASRVVLAVPVIPPSTITALEAEADEVVWVEAPARFYAIGQWYADFSPTSDEEVTDLLARAAAPVDTGAAPGSAVAEEVTVDAGPDGLPGSLRIPQAANGLVVFAHGSGSSRHSPRNRFVADIMQRAGLGTLLFDLLTDEEAPDRARVFDIPLLAERLVQATRWWRARGDPLPIGYFGSSTGAAAALWASTEEDIGAVVSRGGRPDLAATRLAAVRAPTLLIVGGHDDAVLDLNRSAQATLRCESRLEVISGATHLFEEPGALERVAGLARDWFIEHLTLPR
jgi:putative phosphoribosyl transferase